MTTRSRNTNFDHLLIRPISIEGWASSVAPMLDKQAGDVAREIVECVSAPYVCRVVNIDVSKIKVSWRERLAAKLRHWATWLDGYDPEDRDW